MIVNQHSQRDIIYTLNKLIDPFDNTKYIKIYSPTIYIERIEDKINVDIRLNVIKNGRYPEEFLLMDVELPTQKISNIKLISDYTDQDSKDPLPQTRHTPFIYKGLFTIDLNADQYFDREIIQEMVTMKLTFSTLKEGWRYVYVDFDETPALFEKELSTQEVYCSFLYWNTIIYNEQEISIPKKEKYRNNKLVSSECYKFNFILNDFNQSLIQNLGRVEKEKSFDNIIYSRGYSLSFLDVKTGKELFTTKSNLNKKIDNIFLFDSNYDYNIQNKSFVETTKFTGINMFNVETFNVFGYILLKVNNTNFRLKINKNLNRKTSNNFNIKTFNIGKDDEKGVTYNEI